MTVVPADDAGARDERHEIRGGRLRGAMDVAPSPVTLRRDRAPDLLLPRDAVTEGAHALDEEREDLHFAQPVRDAVLALAPRGFPGQTVLAVRAEVDVRRHAERDEVVRLRVRPRRAEPLAPRRPAAAP